MGRRILILSDKGSKVAGQYFQTKHFFALGNAHVFVVDKQGMIRYAYYAKSLLEEPATEEPLAVLAELAGAVYFHWLVSCIAGGRLRRRSPALLRTAGQVTASSMTER